MTTATIAGILRSPQTGRVLNNREIRYELVSAPGSAGGHSSGVIMEPAFTRSDQTGAYTFDVVLNSEIVPEGTFWRVTVGKSYEWNIHVTVAGTYQLTDIAIQVMSPVPPEWVPLAGPPGPQGAAGGRGLTGDPGAIPDCLIADRPLASSVAPGTTCFVLDLNGGTSTRSNGTSWSINAPALATAFGGKHLGGVVLAANYDNVGRAAVSDITGMTVTFTPSGGPVLVVITAFFTMLRRTSWTPVAGTLKAPGALVLLDGAIQVGLSGPDVDASILATSGGGRAIQAGIVYPLFGLTAATSHTVKLQLPAQDTAVTWGVSPAFPTFGTATTRLDLIQLSS